MSTPIQIVDLFAGPGGLGEGFNSLRDEKGKRVFKTLVSVEKEASAHKTLTLRAFYRLLQDHSPHDLHAYYDYLAGGQHPSARLDVLDLWERAEEEAMQLELGGEAGHDALHERLRLLDTSRDWVLIGGPPCQAYSVVGRARNRGVKDYSAEEDKRHFLYREYLDIIARYRPSVFVMENVKGILTSKVGGNAIFRQILDDLFDPCLATGIAGEGTGNGKGYTIFSLADPDVYYPKDSGLSDEELRGFIVQCEDHGIPQARHRVILLGVRNDLVEKISLELNRDSLCLDKEEPVSASFVLDGLPTLRSGLSRNDSQEAWEACVIDAAERLSCKLESSGSVYLASPKRLEISRELKALSNKLGNSYGRGGKQKDKYCQKGNCGNALLDWLSGNEDNYLDFWLNHDSRSHMESDLARYLYCAAFTKVVGRSPNGAKEMYLDELAPMHVNWKSGKFSDRFKVVAGNMPSKTITSHIAKDGHYYIHPDPLQCRSLTVREAARIQTFPDNYYFEGNRTQQYVQVGNAVPPLLAKKVGERVVRLLRG